MMEFMTGALEFLSWLVSMARDDWYLVYRITGKDSETERS